MDSRKHWRRPSLVLLACILASLGFAKKTEPVLDWKPGILWASPDPCDDDFSAFHKQTLLIVGDEVLYHVSRTALLGRKPNVTERGAVKYAMAQGDFYLQDEDGRVFKLSLVKKELNPEAHRRFKSGKQPCQP